jgi:hypothetical protein
MYVHGMCLFTQMDTHFSNPPGRGGKQPPRVRMTGCPPISLSLPIRVWKTARKRGVFAPEPAPESATARVDVANLSGFSPSHDGRVVVRDARLAVRPGRRIPVSPLSHHPW